MWEILSVGFPASETLKRCLSEICVLQERLQKIASPFLLLHLGKAEEYRSEKHGVGYHRHSSRGLIQQPRTLRFLQGQARLSGVELDVAKPRKSGIRDVAEIPSRVFRLLSGLSEAYSPLAVASPASLVPYLPDILGTCSGFRAHFRI